MRDILCHLRNACLVKYKNKGSFIPQYTEIIEFIYYTYTTDFAELEMNLGSSLPSCTFSLTDTTDIYNFRTIFWSSQQPIEFPLKFADKKSQSWK